MIISYYSPGSVPTNLSRGRFGPTTISPGEDIDIKELKCRQGTSADCQVCHTKDTVSHFLLECHKFDNERGTMLTELGSLGLNLNINTILNPPKDSEEMVYGILFKYIKTTGIDM